MLYPKNSEKILDKELFKNPSNEYRGAPFWAWNCELDKEEVISQTHIFQEMGFGGYHAHVRSGLDTEYLGEDFNGCIRASAEEAKKMGMQLYLYDEDRWPSGYAGGIVTKNPRYSARFLRFTTRKSKDEPITDPDGKLLKGKLLLGRYHVCTCGNKLISYKRLSDEEGSAGIQWYAYLETEPPRSFLNNTPYVDTLNKEAIDYFAEITYRTYQENVGEFFGREIKSIFTDEPQFHRFKHHEFLLPFQSECRPLTDDFDNTFVSTYGYSLLDRLPELFWNKNTFSQVRYHYFDHLAERFANAFSDNLGKRCEEMGISLTGHLMEEPKLSTQTQSVADAMRQYRGFQIPGIDMLGGRFEFTTAKQAQSALRQYGREGMLSELYGVSRWDSDFRKYKIGGDWQAALGVTLRVPHLSLMSMKGFSKRDYPASIFYQSPWYKKFKYLEDHFARVNTALTRGRPLTEIAVIHPIESFWSLYGNSNTKSRCDRYDRKFTKITDLLLRAGLDFDFISESTLPELNTEGNYPLKVGNMEYKTVLVPNCITLRTSTIDRLKDFQSKGGKVVFVGDVPEFENGIPSNRSKELAKKSIQIRFKEKEILEALESNRLYGIYEKGKHTNNIICQLREDNDAMWLFLSRVEKELGESKKQNLMIKVKGEWKGSIWDTLSGDIIPVVAIAENGYTFINTDMNNHDSILLRLDKEEKDNKENKPVFAKTLPLDEPFDYSISEPNVLLLDRAYYALDKGGFSRNKYELLHLDNICRKKCGYKKRSGKSSQPWISEKTPPEHSIKLKFIINSKIEVKDTYLALEDAEKATIFLNGSQVEVKICGYYVDKAIKKVLLPTVKKGRNNLEIVLPFGRNTDVEWCYLLGDFGVNIRGSRATLTSLPGKLKYGDITKQGFPFYGGEITYKVSFEGNGKPVSLSVPKYSAGILEAKTSESGIIAFAPYSVLLPSGKGPNDLSITAYISRQNAFGPNHFPSARTSLTSPGTYYLPRAITTKKYWLSKAGILVPPEVSIQ